MTARPWLPQPDDDSDNPDLELAEHTTAWWRGLGTPADDNEPT
ncbi:hypothetical protein [Streptomyces cupreus]|nr:hypothetical protein [Streptomyces cupreus]